MEASSPRLQACDRRLSNTSVFRLRPRTVGKRIESLYQTFWRPCEAGAKGFQGARRGNPASSPRARWCDPRSVPRFGHPAGIFCPISRQIVVVE